MFITMVYTLLRQCSITLTSIVTYCFSQLTLSMCLVPAFLKEIEETWKLLLAIEGVK